MDALERHQMVMRKLLRPDELILPSICDAFQVKWLYHHSRATKYEVFHLMICGHIMLWQCKLLFDLRNPCRAFLGIIAQMVKLVYQYSTFSSVNWCPSICSLLQAFPKK